MSLVEGMLIFISDIEFRSCGFSAYCRHLNGKEEKDEKEALKRNVEKRTIVCRLEQLLQSSQMLDITRNQRRDTFRMEIS